MSAKISFNFKWREYTIRPVQSGQKSKTNFVSKTYPKWIQVEANAICDTPTSIYETRIIRLPEHEPMPSITFYILHIHQAFTELVIILISDHLTICGTSRLSEALTFSCKLFRCASPVYSSVYTSPNNRTFWKNELFVAPWWAQHGYCLGSLRLNAKSSWWKVFAWTPRQQGFLHTLLQPPFCCTI